MYTIDWFDRREGVFWTGATALVALATGVESEYGPQRVLPALPIMVGLTLGVLAVVRSRRWGAWQAGYARAAAFLAAGVWAATTCQIGHVTGTLLQVLAFGAVTFGAVTGTWPMPDDEVTAPGLTPTPPMVTSPRDEWGMILAEKANVRGAKTIGRIDWPSGGGYSVTVDFGETGHTWRDLTAHTGRFGSRLRLPTGCGVEVAPGTHDAEAVIEVSTKDMLAQYRPYDDTSPLTINGPLPMGWFRNGDPVEVRLREKCMFCVAETGGGKTNFLHQLTAGLCRCPDALVWIVDLSAGGLANPWMLPYLDGSISRPVVDWVADNPDEAVAMMTCALEMIHERRRFAQTLMDAADTDLVPVSADLPAVHIIIDETAAAMANSSSPDAKVIAEFVRLAIKVVQEGRAAGFRMTLSGLRATSTVIPPDVLALLTVRAAFGVTSAEEACRALGWENYKAMSLRPSAHQGAGQWRGSSTEPIRDFRTLHAAKPSTIRRVAVETVGCRPVMDDATLRIMHGSWYRDRWGRYEAAHGSPVGGTRGHADTVRTVSGDTADTTPRTGGGQPADTTRTPDTGHRTVVAADTDTLSGDEVSARFADIVSGLVGRSLSAPASPDTIRERAMVILAGAGTAGMSGAQLAERLAVEGYQVPGSTLYAWLNRAAVKLGHGRWVHPGHTGNSTGNSSTP